MTNSTIIAKCDCYHEYQDQKYGKGNRVMNPVTKKTDTYRCTVCAKEKKV